MPHRILLHVSLAAAAALSAVGFWFLWSTNTAVPAWLGIPLTAKVVFIVLAVVARLNRSRAYSDGIAYAQMDAGTRLPSFATAAQVLDREFAAAERGRELSVVLFSIDNYRKLIVQDGGRMRQKLLLNVGNVLRRRTRGMNITAPHSDEGQYIAVLSGVGVDGAITFTSRVRKDLASLRIGAVPLVVSAGVCGYEPGMDSGEALLRRAREALIKAKRSGSGDLEVAPQAKPDLSTATAYEIA
ncbi:MAG TPA: diguanylate cyclase [Longimicrobiales bacterium]